MPESRWRPSGQMHDRFEIVASASTHPGLARSHNEDAWLIGPPVFLVADGMGGHEAGDVASRLVVQAFQTLAGRDVATVADVEEAITSARTHIEQLGSTAANAPGSTLIAVTHVVEGGRSCWLIANVGDSRAYLLTREGLEQVSRDHSLVQELLDAGEIDAQQALNHPERHVITRAIGAVDACFPEYALVPIEAEQQLLLCSDGLTGELDDREIERIMRDSPTVQTSATRLVAAAVEAGGNDNVTALVIHAVGETEVLPLSAIGADTVPTIRSGA